MRGWNSSFVASHLSAHPWPSKDQHGPVHTADQDNAPTALPLQSVPAPAARPTPSPAQKPEPATDTSLFKRLSPEEVAKDIDLLASDTPAELKSKRRRFARINHPDRVPMQWRQAATTRMKIANHMVDEALRRI